MAAGILGCSLAASGATAELVEIPLATGPDIEAFYGWGNPSAALAGGGFAAVWLELTFFDESLQMQWIDADGQIVFEDGGRTLAAGGVGSATLAAKATGGVFVAFGGSFANQAGVKVQSFDAAGDPQWPGEGVAASTLDGLQGTPMLVPDSSGGVYVCFGVSSTESLRCQHFGADGVPSWAPEGVDPGGAPGTRFHSLGVSDGQGGLLVFWRTQRGGTPGPETTMLIEGQRLTRDGNRLWGDGLLVRDTFLPPPDAPDPGFLGVVSDGSGGAVLSFDARSGPAETDPGIVAQRVAGDGTLLWSGGSVVVSDAPVLRQRETIQPPDGGIVVIATEFVGGVERRVRLFRLDADGQ
ncbi:MAG: hypothetical protein MI919_01980, partial [Holophagales bacterium]|nr:hypothetical protein [Holophagales bacterium]